MTAQADSVASAIADSHSGSIESLRGFVTSVAMHGGWSPIDDVDWPRESRRVEGPAITLRGVEIRVGLNFFDPAGLGSFPGSATPTGCQIILHGYRTQTRAPVGLAASEVEGWGRAVLGEAWSRHAYTLQSPTRTSPVLVDRVMVLLDRSGQPVPIPTAFRFEQVPRGTAPVLWQRMDRTTREPGQSTGTHPQVAEPQRVPTASTEPDDAEPAIRALNAALQSPGAVAPSLQLARLTYDGGLVIIEFLDTSRNTVVRTALVPPTVRDFTEGVEFFRQHAPRLSPPLHDPDRWAAGVREFFREQYATGMLGSIDLI